MIQRTCTLFAVLALFLQGSSGGHMLLVEHTRCAEHGDLVHGDGAHDHGGADARESRAQTALTGSTQGSDDAHEHCALCADRRAAIAVVAESVLNAPVARPAPRLPTHEDAPLSGAPCFRLAPKTSPPA